MSSDPHVRPPPPEPFRPEPRCNGDSVPAGAADAGSQPDEPTQAAQPDAEGREGPALLLEQFRELWEYALYYAAARTDGVKRTVRDALHRVVYAALGFVALAGLTIIASWFVLSGIAQGASAWCGGRAWLGALLTGALTLAGVGVALFGTAWLRKNAARKRTVHKYAKRHAQQRARFGRDVQDEEPATVARHE